MKLIVILLFLIIAFVSAEDQFDTKLTEFDANDSYTNDEELNILLEKLSNFYIEKIFKKKRPTSHYLAYLNEISKNYEMENLNKRFLFNHGGKLSGLFTVNRNTRPKKDTIKNISD